MINDHKNSLLTYFSENQFVTMIWWWIFLFLTTVIYDHDSKNIMMVIMPSGKKKQHAFLESLPIPWVMFPLSFLPLIDDWPLPVGVTCV